MIKQRGVEDGLNWSKIVGMLDARGPITVRSKAVVDDTRHPCEVVKGVEDKVGPELHTKTGRIMGEKSMWADRAESIILENVGEVYPGLYVAGMAANAVHGSPRMGPIFGGMLLSGERVAQILIEKLE